MKKFRIFCIEISIFLFSFVFLLVESTTNLWRVHKIVDVSQPAKGYHSFTIFDMDPTQQNYFFSGGMNDENQYSNVIWKFDPESSQFSMVCGNPAVVASLPSYNITQSIGQSSNSRGWIIGDLMYIHGGENSNGLRGDIFRYNISSSNTTTCQWEYEAGSTSPHNEDWNTPIVGTCFSKFETHPGSRRLHNTWLDPHRQNRLYFGFGDGYGEGGVRNIWNDLWFYEVNSQMFCVENIAMASKMEGNYFLKGQYNINNSPPSRMSAISWTWSNPAGSDLCIFGGVSLSFSNRVLNDMLCFNTSLGEWKWLHGHDAGESVWTNYEDNLDNYYARYVNNGYGEGYPGGRSDASSLFINNKFLIIGYGKGFSNQYCSNYALKASGILSNFDCFGYLSDMWVYSMSENQWSMLSSFETRDVNLYHQFNNSKTFDERNNPESRYGSFFAISKDLNSIYVFGGRFLNRFYKHVGILISDNDLWINEFDSALLLFTSSQTCIIESYVFGICRARGECLDSGICKCQTGYSGDFCETFTCYGKYMNETDTCSNQGNCFRWNDCQCYEGRGGRECHLSIDNNFIQCIGPNDCIDEINNLRILDHPGAAIVSSTWTHNGNIFRFGGYGCDNISCSTHSFLSDLWEFDVSLRTWKQLELGEVPISRDVRVSNVENSHVYMYGGMGVQYQYVHADLWVFSHESISFHIVHGSKNSHTIDCDKPPLGNTSFGNYHPGSRHGNGIWQVLGMVYIYGGLDSQYFPAQSDVWAFSPTLNKWAMLYHGIQTTVSIPTRGHYDDDIYPQVRSYMMYWSVGIELFIFGGRDSYGVNLNDLIAFSTEVFQWKFLGGEWLYDKDSYHGYVEMDIYHNKNWPGARFQGGHAQVNLYGHDLFIIYGGEGFGRKEINEFYGYLNDIWIYNLTIAQWKFLGGSFDIFSGEEIVNSTATFPKGTVSQSLVSFEGQTHLYLFSGGYYSTFSADYWSVDLNYIFEFPPNVNTTSGWEIWVFLSVILVCSLLVGIFVLGFVCVVIILIIFLKKKKKNSLDNVIVKEVELNVKEKSSTVQKKQLKETSLVTPKEQNKDEDVSKIEKKLLSKVLKSKDYSKLNFKNIHPKEVHMEKEIGSGGQSSIFRATWKRQKVAVKMYTLYYDEKQIDEIDLSSISREISLISSLSHPNIVQFYGTFVKKNKLAVVMQYVENGDIRNYISTHQNELSLREKMRILSEIASVMEFLHEKNIIHRCENVLLDNSLQCVLVDFGLSRAVEEESGSITKGIGTAHLMAPEITLGMDYNFKIDVFSFSIMVFEILVEEFKNPYGVGKKEKQFIQFKIANNPNFRPDIDSKVGIPKFLKELAKKCWNHDPSQRLSFKEIYETIKSKYFEKESVVVYVKSSSQIHDSEAVDYELSDFSIAELRNKVNDLKGEKKFFIQTKDTKDMVELTCDCDIYEKVNNNDIIAIQ